MSDWIDCMSALEPELLEVTIRSYNPRVEKSIKCSCRSRAFLTAGGGTERCLNVFQLIFFCQF